MLLFILYCKYVTSHCRWRLVGTQTLFNQSLHQVEMNMVRSYYNSLLSSIRSLHMSLGLLLV